MDNLLLLIGLAKRRESCSWARSLWAPAPPGKACAAGFGRIGQHRAPGCARPGGQEFFG